MIRAGRVLERIAVAIGLCVLAISFGVALLVAPPFTRIMVARLDVAAASGLSAERAAATADHVRRFVVSPDAAPLPAEVDGRAAFDNDAVSHLEDVRVLIRALRTSALVLGAVLLVWLALSLRVKRVAQVASALRWGGYACVGTPVVLALAGLLDFDALFSGFHGVFFDVGTWVFPSDSLLIELFPERFWMASAVALALLVAVEGAVFWLLGSALARRRAPRGEHEHQAEA